MMESFEHEVAVFSAARRLPAGERAAYLNETCAGDATLRQHVEELLRASEEADEFLQDPALGAQRPTVALTSPDSLPKNAVPGERVGDCIGRYKLLQQIGEGGCGVVYVAEQEEPVRRRVALKVIKLGMDTKSVIARFEAERQALAMMDHPSIAKVFDAGSTEAGRPYFVMELVRGIKITEFCDENKLSTEERLRLFTQVCQAIQHAHQKGVIHRDIKPSNVLVTVNEPGAPGCPKVIDFGIAKATNQQPLTNKTVFTAFEQFIGTPAYMSPEQAVMTALDVDTRSDIYSLGVLLYELLTGRTPFDQKELLAAGLDEMRRTIREKEPERPSTRLSTMVQGELTTTAKRRHTEAPKLLSAIRGDLDWIVMKCLEKDRARRYETANGLATDIQRHLSNEPVVACPPSNIYRLQKLVRRNKLAFAAGAGTAAALVLGLCIATWGLVREREARNRATTAEKSAKTELARSQQVAQFLQAMLKGVGPSKAKGRDTQMLREILDKTTERIGKELAKQPEVEADLLLTIGSVYDDLAEFEKAETVLRRALSIRQELYPDGDPEVAIALNDLSILLDHLGRLTEAEDLLRKSLAMKRDPADSARSLVNLGNILLHQGKPAEAATTYRDALAILTERLGGQNRQVAEVRVLLAHVLADQGKLAEAETIYREALALIKKVHGEEDPMVAATLIGLGKALAQDHRLVEAEAMMRQALAIERKVYGDEHPQTAAAVENLADVLMGEGKLVEVEAMRREVLAIRRKSLGREHQDTALALNKLAFVLMLQNQLADAEAMYREGLRIQTQSCGREHPRTAAMLVNLGELLAQRGQLQEAEALMREGLEISQRVLGSEHPDVATALDKLVGVLERADKYQEAEPLMREALAIREKLFGSEHPQVAILLNNLGETLSRRGKLAEAEELYRRALAMRRKFVGQRDPEAVTTLCNLARVLTKAGKLAEAKLHAAEALTLRKKLLSDETPQGACLGTTLIDLASALHRQGSVTEALPLIRDGVELLRKQSVGDGKQAAPVLGQALTYFASVLAELRELTEARTLAEEAVALYRRTADSAVQEQCAAFDVLGKVLADQGNFVEAQAVQSELVAILRKRAPDISNNGGALAELAVTLMAQKKFVEAQSVARQSLEFRQKNFPETWHQFSAQVLVGESLLGQKRYAEAEALLRSGYEGMMQRKDKLPPGSGGGYRRQPRLKKALELLVQLYEETGQPDRAAEWKQKLVESEKAEAKTN